MQACGAAYLGTVCVFHCVLVLSVCVTVSWYCLCLGTVCVLVLSVCVTVCLGTVCVCHCVSWHSVYVSLCVFVLSVCVTVCLGTVCVCHCVSWYCPYVTLCVLVLSVSWYCLCLGTVYVCHCLSTVCLGTVRVLSASLHTSQWVQILELVLKHRVPLAALLCLMNLSPSCPSQLDRMNSSEGCWLFSDFSLFKF